MSSEFSSTSGNPDSSADAAKKSIEKLNSIIRNYELNSSATQNIAERQRQITKSRFYPLAVLLLKIDIAIERVLRKKIRPQTPDSPSPDRQAVSKETTQRNIKFQLKTAIRTIVKGTARAELASSQPFGVYGTWSEIYCDLTDGRVIELNRWNKILNVKPKFSIVMATYNSDSIFLKKSVDSVLSQVYEDFELIISDDCSSDPSVVTSLRKYAAMDSRIKVIENSKNSGISGATNKAIDAATGEFVVFMDHDDTLVPYALLHLALAINNNHNTALIYSDEDKINEFDQVFMPHFKSDFDPFLLLGQNYICHLNSIRTDLIREVGGLRSEFDGSQDWDLVLRVTEKISKNQIVHVPIVLYHWRSHSESTSQTSSAKPWALESGYRAVKDALVRRGIDAEVTQKSHGLIQVKYTLPPDAPLVSVIIPTRDGVFLDQCLESLLRITKYPNYEVIVIDNGSQKQSTHDIFARLDKKIKVLRDDSPFNYSALHNRAVSSCAGSILLLLNDDTKIIQDDWLDVMVATLLNEGVGAVGAKLLYPDETVQHAGVILGPEGLAAHVGKSKSRSDRGYFDRSALTSEFQACTAACLAVRKETWDDVGGFDERFAVAFNDIDFCLRVRESGSSVLFTPYAELIHHESVTRGIDTDDGKFERFVEEIREMRVRWPEQIAADPYYNPNLSLNYPLFEVAFPPRISPWSISLS